MKLSWFDWMFSFDQSRGALWWCLHGRHLHGIAAYGRWVCAPNLWLENPEFRIVRSLGRLNKLCTVGDGCVSQSMIYNLPWKGLSGMADYSYRLTSTNRWQKRQSSHLHRCFCIRNLTRSLRSLVRFLIRQQLVCKYRTQALSMKYSLYMIWYANYMISMQNGTFRVANDRKRRNHFLNITFLFLAHLLSNVLNLNIKGYHLS